MEVPSPAANSQDFWSPEVPGLLHCQQVLYAKHLLTSALVAMTLKLRCLASSQCPRWMPKPRYPSLLAPLCGVYAQVSLSLSDVLYFEYLADLNPCLDIARHGDCVNKSRAAQGWRLQTLLGT